MKRIICCVIATLLLCSCAAIAGDAHLPGKGEVISSDRLLELARADGKNDIVAKLSINLPEKLFVSDGCSGGCPDTWHGRSIYAPCFWHDVRYYLGGPMIDKLQADAQLMLDVAEITGDPDWAVAMFNGVWIGGNLPAPWQWGKVGVEK